MFGNLIICKIKLILFILIYLRNIPYIRTYQINKNLIATIESYECFPCIDIKKELLIGLPASHSPCLKEGQPIFKWPNSSEKGCSPPKKLYSKQFDYDVNSGIAFAKYFICFYTKEWKISYKILCNSSSKMTSNSIRIFHEVS